MSRYCNPAIKELKDQQVRYTPREVRIEQIERAERLLEEIDSAQTYPYHKICEQITSYRPERYPDMVVSGKDAVHDLRLFVEDLSDSVDLDASTMSEPVLTVKDVSERYNVSTKTVDRWRDRGLASRRFVFGKRKRVGFLESTVDRFVRKHSDQVDRGTRFSQLSETEREEIIRRARRLARYGGCPSDISRRLARRLGRSPETIRYTLKNFDKEHPELAVFPNSSGPLDDTQRGEIFARFRRGVSVDDLAKQFCRTRASIYRVISEVRAPAVDGNAHRLHGQSGIPREERGHCDSGVGSGTRRLANADQGTSRASSVSGKPLHGWTTDARRRSVLLPQDELPQVQGIEASREAESGSPECSRDGRHRKAR